MSRIYVAGAFGADNMEDVGDNMRRGMELAYDILCFGHNPFVPWFDFQFKLLDKNGICTRNRMYAYSLGWLDACDAIVVVPEGYERSEGTLRELERAAELGIPSYIGFMDFAEHFRPYP